MILPDTSVWIEHFRKRHSLFAETLSEGQVLMHSFVRGELACGNLRNRKEIMELLKMMPNAQIAEEDEVLSFIDGHSLMGKGLGWIDMHLLASALLSEAELWTLDNKLHRAAVSLGIAFKP